MRDAPADVLMVPQVTPASATGTVSIFPACLPSIIVTEMRDCVHKGRLPMKKTLIPLLILGFVLSIAPTAMADHCTRCKTFVDGTRQCWFAVTGGYPFCEVISNNCVFTGTLCTGPHPFTDEAEPLAADFTVAIVERLDESQPAAECETRVASLETTPTAVQH
jgi:hypothetical protein